ncbi:MAG: hypothetical protein ACJ75H_06075 [Thermoanaerobaculia bacterium]
MKKKIKGPKDWDALLKTARRHECELGGVAPFLAALAGAHDQAVSLKSLRDSLDASANDADLRLKAVLERGHDAAVNLRSYIVSVLGVKNPKLREYGLTPRGKLRRPPKPELDAAPARKKGVRKTVGA